jgi:holo-[acyl-carrier protein] synthase
MTSPTNQQPPSLRVGIDLARVSDTRRSIDLFGDRYLRRVFTARELDDCFGGVAREVAEARLTARFAAKEAAVKVLRPAGPPHEGWLDWRSIEVLRAPGGWTELHLSGDADALARRAGLGSLAVSLSHDGDLATAVVIAT